MAAQVSQQPTPATSALAAASEPSLPGIVTDQPEIYESIPSPNEVLINQAASDIVEGNQLSDGAFDLKEVPIKDAFSFFAEREQEIAQFFVQRYGEYKIKSEHSDEETDVERYYRLVSEVSELLDKFKSRKTDNLSDINSSKLNLTNSAKIVDNLEQLSSQLKLLELEANNGSLNENQYQLNKLETRLHNLTQEPELTDINKEISSQQTINVPHKQDLTQAFKLNSLERKIASIEVLLGHNEDKERSIRDRTKCESLYEAADKLAFWMQHFLPRNFDKVDKELDYLTTKLNSIQDKQDTSLDSKTKNSLDRLSEMLTSTDKYKAMIPEIINRLALMEEVQQKAAQVVVTVNYLEQVQSKIQKGIEDNSEQLSKLKTVFAENIENMKVVTAEIDKRISAIKEVD